MGKFALVAGKRPVKRPALAVLSDDPVARAKARYVSSRVTLRELVEEFKGLPGCSWSTLTKLSAEEDWAEEREKSRDRVVTGTVSALEAQEVKRNAEHLRMTRNTLNTVEGILSGIHYEVGKVIELQGAGTLAAVDAIRRLRALSAAAANVARAQGFGITLEQRLGDSEGSSFERFADAADTTYREVMGKRAELVKRADEAADRLEAEKKGARKRARGTA